MTAYLIFDEDVTDPEGFQEYIQLAGPVLKRYGGNSLPRMEPLKGIGIQTSW
jgi:uncharacterized protein (DUF1330 family)